MNMKDDNVPIEEKFEEFKNSLPDVYIDNGIKLSEYFNLAVELEVAELKWRNYRRLNIQIGQTGEKQLRESAMGDLMFWWNETPATQDTDLLQIRIGALFVNRLREKYDDIIIKRL